MKNKNELFIKDNILPEGNITKEILKKYSIGILTVFEKKKIFNKYKFKKIIILLEILIFLSN